MDVIINGEQRELAGGSTVEYAVRSLTAAASGVAAAVNDEIVPKARWADTALQENDRLDVLTAVQGG